MRLTLINQFYLPDISPTAHLCAALAEHRAGRGDRVTVLTSSSGYLRSFKHDAARPAIPERPAADSALGALSIRRLWTLRLGSRTNVRRLLDWISFYPSAIIAAARLPGQDVVICLTTPPFIALAGWIHQLMHPRCRLILWCMDVYPEALEQNRLIRRCGIVSQLMRSANRAVFKRLDHLVCLDDAMLHLLLSQYTPRGRKVPGTVIPNFERLSLFPEGTCDASCNLSTGALTIDSASAGAATRDATESTVGKLVVLYLGNAGYGHEFRTILRAAAMLKNEAILFFFVGGGPLRQWLERRSAAERLTNIRFQDYVPKEQTPQLMRLAGCALITLDDALLGVMSPSKLHANLAMGLPILYIGPAGGNVDHAIARFGCGASVRPGDAAGAAAFIRTLQANPAQSADLRRRSRRAFEEAYSDRAVLPQFDALIDGASPLA